MKRGAISMEMIIIIILALIALVIIVFFFTGSMTELKNRITGVYKTYTAEDISMVRDRCSIECSMSPKNFCALEIPLRNTKTGLDDSVKCEDTKIGASCPGVKCP